MPPLSTDSFKPLAVLTFAGYGYQLPSEPIQPADAFGAECKDKVFPPDMTAAPALLPAWFTPREAGNKDFQSTCDRIGTGYKALAEDLIDAVRFAHGLWKLQAGFESLQIMGTTAIGGPGCLSGPELEGLILGAPSCAGFTGNKKKYLDAVAAGLSKCFKNWQDQVTVPGLPWFPTFAAVTSKVAAPTANIPLPLVACVSAAASDITVPGAMKRAFVDAFTGNDRHHDALFAAVEAVLCAAFLMWLPQQQVMQVMGQGPVPAFNPPYVPAAPVIGGSTVAGRGHLAL